MSDETKEMTDVVSEVQAPKTVNERAVPLVTSIPISVGNRGQLAYQTESAADLVGIEVDAGLEITRFTAGKATFKRAEGQAWKDVLVAPDNRIPAGVYVMIVVENRTGEEVIGKGTLILANEEAVAEPVGQAAAGPSAPPPDAPRAEKRAPREATFADVVVRRRPVPPPAVSAGSSRVIRTARTETPPAGNAVSNARLERLSDQVAPNPGERAISLLSLDVDAVSNWLDNGIPLLSRVRATLASRLGQEIVEGTSAMGDNEVVVSITQADAEKLRAYAAYEGPELSADAQEDAEIRVRISKAFRSAFEAHDDQAERGQADRGPAEIITVHASTP